MMNPAQDETIGTTKMCPCRYTRHAFASKMVTCATLSLVVVGACTTQDVASDTAAARFASYPTALFDAAESACDGPAESFVKVSSQIVECRMYLPPRETAALILQNDGTPENLPQLVVRLQTRKDGTGYLVETYTYAEVPQISGGVVRLNQMSGAVKRRLKQIYVATGATPDG